MKIRSDFLQQFFGWFGEVVDAAENPAAKLASILLPILAPIVPAFITALRMIKVYTELAAGLALPLWVPKFGATTTAIVLELLGWVGTIALVRFIYRWIKTRDDAYMVPAGMTFLAYVSYVVDMVVINVQVNSGHYEVVLFWLALLTIPAGLIFAVNLVGKQEDANDYVLRQEQREDRLKAKALKQGINIFSPTQTFASDTPAVRVVGKKHDWRQLTEDEKREVVNVLTPTDITKKYDVSRSTAFAWKKNSV